MISTKTINNQNAITNAVLGTDNNSTTTINGNLLIRDTNGNALTITPSGVTAPTNTILNNLTVNGTSIFTGNETHNGNATFKDTYFNQGFQIRDPGNLNNLTQVYHTGPNMVIQPLPSNSKIRLST